MNYQKIYDNLIQSAQLRPDISFLNGYTERHHILPKSMGGSDDASNLVRLTAREHFVAHHLLWRIHHSEALAYAFWAMCHQKNNGRDYKVNSRFYEKIRKIAISHISKSGKKRVKENNPFYGKSHSEETKAILRQKLLGKKHSEESKRKMSKSRIGLKHTEEARRNMSLAQKGKKRNPEKVMRGEKHPMFGKRGELNPMFGKKLSDEARQKIKEKRQFQKMKTPVMDKLSEHKDEIIQMLKQGIDQKQIWEKYNCSRNRLQTFIRNYIEEDIKQEIAKTAPSVENTLEKNYDEVIALLNAGNSQAKVGERFGVSQSALCNFLKKHKKENGNK